MLNYYGLEKLNDLHIADMQQAAEGARLVKLTTTTQPRSIGRTRTAFGQLMIRLGTRIAPPAQPLAPQPEAG